MYMEHLGYTKEIGFDTTALALRFRGHRDGVNIWYYKDTLGLWNQG